MTFRSTDPPTSRAASRLERTRLRDQVDALLMAHPDGLTDWEATDLLELSERRKPTVAKRRGELGAVPVVGADGATLTRPSPDGCECIVWRHPNLVGGQLRLAVP